MTDFGDFGFSGVGGPKGATGEPGYPVTPGAASLFSSMTGGDAAAVTLTADAPTAVLSQPLTGLKPSTSYLMTLRISCYSWYTWSTAVSGTHEATVCLRVTTDANAVATAITQGDAYFSAASASAALGSLVLALTPITGGFSVVATRPAGASISVRTRWFADEIYELPLGGTLTNAQLLAEWQRIYPTGRQGLWVGDSAVLSGSNIESIPALEGNTLTNATAARFQQRVVNGRKTIYSAVEEFKSLTCATVSPPVSFAAVARMVTLPQAYHSTLCRGLGGDGNTEALIVLPNAYTWAREGLAQTVTHYRNGVADENVTAGEPAVYEGTLSANAAQGIRVGGSAFDYPNYWRTWREDILLVRALSVYPSASQRAEEAALFAAWAGIV